MYSDGISETVDPAEEMFGYERTIETVPEACAEGIGAEELVDRLMSRAREFAGRALQARIHRYTRSRMQGSRLVEILATRFGPARLCLAHVFD